MIRVDLHCHSKFSAHPSEWFLQKIGTRESYTEVEEVYRQARSRGMTYVTITDHNTIEGALRLKEAHPEDTFVSAEVTAYFPEDGCKAHVLVFDLTPAQFDAIQGVRNNIYNLRDYLKREHLACSVAHATYSVNGKLTKETLEKLILLFDVFEAVNGSRGCFHNEAWGRLLRGLTPDDIDRLYRKHRIDPWGKMPWVKGFTAGSDDHAGLFIGKTCTLCPDAGIPGFIESIRSKETSPGGRHGDHKGLAFSVYKIALDFSRERGGGNGDGVLSMLSSLLFDEERAGLKNWLTIQKLKAGRDTRTQAVRRFFEEIAGGRDADAVDVEQRMDRAYLGLGRLADDFFALLATSVERDLRNGQAERLLKNLSAALPAAFIIAPFISSMRHLHQQGRPLEELRASMGAQSPKKQRRLLWFSDTVTDLNGVAVTMRELAKCAQRTGRPMKLVTCLPDSEAETGLPPNTLNLPCIYSITPEFYTAYTLRLPSILQSVDGIAAEEPDEIVVSTPGPVGLLGFAAARLLGIKCTGVYHTDFTRQADQFIGDAWVSSVIESYTRWFFRQMDEVRVPTERYIDILSERGLDRSKMRLFRRGIESSFVVDDPAAREALRARFRIPRETPTLLWAGRLGKEKNLEFLLDVYAEVARQRPQITLLIAGDGPELERLKEQSRDDGRILFTGRLARDELAHLYALADLFVFPSTTDTFGMVVLEAQACGLPALVTDVGGPQEIVRNGETGFVIAADNKRAWVSAVVGLLDMKDQDPADFEAMRARAREVFHTDYGWESVLDEMMGEDTGRRQKSAPRERRGVATLDVPA